MLSSSEAHPYRFPGSIQGVTAVEHPVVAPAYVLRAMYLASIALS